MDYIKDNYTSKDLYEDFFDTYGTDQYRFWQLLNIYPFLQDFDEEQLLDNIYDAVIETLHESEYRYQYFQDNIKNMPYFDLLYDYEEETGGEILDLQNKELTQNCLSEWAYDEIFQEDLINSFGKCFSNDFLA